MYVDTIGGFIFWQTELSECKSAWHCLRLAWSLKASAPGPGNSTQLRQRSRIISLKFIFVYLLFSRSCDLDGKDGIKELKVLARREGLLFTRRHFAKGHFLEIKSRKIWFLTRRSKYRSKHQNSFKSKLNAFCTFLEFCNSCTDIHRINIYLSST